VSPEGTIEDHNVSEWSYQTYRPSADPVVEQRSSLCRTVSDPAMGSGRGNATALVQYCDPKRWEGSPESAS